MAENPLDAVYAYAERTYLRLQAGDLLIRCIDEGSVSPIQQVVEGLVLAGPQSLGAMREILVEVSQRKHQLENDMQQVYTDMLDHLKSYGARIKGYKTPLSITRLTPVRFLAMLREQEINDQETQVSCLSILRESRALLKNLASHLRLMSEIEHYLQDWMLGLVYQSAHEVDRVVQAPGIERKL